MQDVQGQHAYIKIRQSDSWVDTNPALEKFFTFKITAIYKSLKLFTKHYAYDS